MTEFLQQAGVRLRFDEEVHIVAVVLHAFQRHRVQALCLQDTGNLVLRHDKPSVGLLGFQDHVDAFSRNVVLQQQFFGEVLAAHQSAEHSGVGGEGWELVKDCADCAVHLDVLRGDRGSLHHGRENAGVVLQLWRLLEDCPEGVGLLVVVVFPIQVGDLRLRRFLLVVGEPDISSLQQNWSLAGLDYLAGVVAALVLAIFPSWSNVGLLNAVNRTGDCLPFVVSVRRKLVSREVDLTLVDRILHTLGREQVALVLRLNLTLCALCSGRLSRDTLCALCALCALLRLGCWRWCALYSLRALGGDRLGFDRLRAGSHPLHYSPAW